MNKFKDSCKKIFVKTAPVNISNNTSIINGDTYDGNDSNFDEDDYDFL